MLPAYSKFSVVPWYVTVTRSWRCAYSFALCICILSCPLSAHAAARRQQALPPPATMARCGPYVYKLPSGYAAKDTIELLTNPHMILLNPPFKKIEKDMWESQAFCLQDNIRGTEYDAPAFMMREIFTLRTVAKQSIYLEIHEFMLLPDNKAGIYLLTGVHSYIEGNASYIKEESLPYYYPVVPVIEVRNTKDDSIYYLVFVERSMSSWPDKPLPKESKEEKKQRMRKLSLEVHAAIQSETAR